MSSKVKLTCNWCGCEMERWPSTIKERNFCSRACLGNFSSKTMNPEGYAYKNFDKVSANMTQINQRLNPTRMVTETREKLRKGRLGKGEGKCYEKTYGRHTHRVVAEELIGRPLISGEVVHHIDGNKRNNSPSNLMVFPSQKEHAKWHFDHDKSDFKKGGDPNEL